MTEPQQKQRSAGVVTAVVSLVAVCIFWAVYFVSRHPTKPLSTQELTDELEKVKPPEGAQRNSLFPIQAGDSKPNHVTAMYYSTASDCKNIAEHYKNEFSRLGFVQQTRFGSDVYPAQHSQSLFCSHKTSALFVCQTQTEGYFYMISLSSPDDRC